MKVLSCGYILLTGPYDLLANENDGDMTRFFVIGDWGGLPFSPYETPSEVVVAKTMGKLGKKLNTSFQLALGDNFYFNGVQSATDSRFQVRCILIDEVKFLFIYIFSIRLNVFSRQHH